MGLINILIIYTKLNQTSVYQVYFTIVKKKTIPNNHTKKINRETELSLTSSTFAF